MSLLYNQEYALHQMRTKYLNNMRDGVGERLINLNTTVFNVQGYKNAGWPNPSDIRKTYSPPIPAGGSTDYFAALPRSAALEKPKHYDDEADDDVKAGGKAVAGGSHGSLKGFHRDNNQRRSMGQGEDDDSSDLSDDSDFDDEPGRALNQIKFSKMPVRQRAGSSPTHYTNPKLLITSPSKFASSRTRSGSHGMMEYEKSKNLTSDDDALDMLSHRIDEDTQAFKDIAQQLRASPATSFRNHDVDFDSDDMVDDGDDDDDSTISSNFTETGGGNATLLSNGVASPPPIAPLFAAHGPKASSQLDPLPPPRPISIITPISALTQLIKANQEEIQHPLDTFTKFSGKGDMKAAGPSSRRFGQAADASGPMRLKVYRPSCDNPLKPFEVIVKRSVVVDGIKHDTTVSDALGFILYRYREDDRQPPLTEEQYNVNMWNLHIMDEEGEPDEDFPPLDRARVMSTYNYEELVLMPTSKEQFEENERLYPSKKVAKEEKKSVITNAAAMDSKAEMSGPSKPADAPNIGQQSGTRTGPLIHLKIFCNTPEVFDQTVMIRITSDSYIGEVLDIICKKKHLDSSRHSLRLRGTTIVVPLDRTVQELGGRGELELTIRGPFDPISDKSGSPSLSNPTNSSLFGAAKQSNKKATLLSQSVTTHDVLSSAGYQKFTVWRKMPMSFISRHERVLAIDGEYVHIMPSDQNKTLWDSPKTTSIHISSIIGCKQSRKAPLNFKIIAMKSREWKRYAFEATSPAQAGEIVEALKRQISAYKMDKEQ